MRLTDEQIAAIKAARARFDDSPNEYADALLADLEEARAADPFEAVLAFHRRFECFIGSAPGWPPKTTAAMRRTLVSEEAAELERAIDDGDLIAVADALADLLYVTYGMAITFGIDIRPVFAEVHRSNMAKVGGPTRGDGKILKPEGWQSPDIAGAIRGIEALAVTEQGKSRDGA